MIFIYTHAYEYIMWVTSQITYVRIFTWLRHKIAKQKTSWRLFHLLTLNFTKHLRTFYCRLHGRLHTIYSRLDYNRWETRFFSKSISSRQDFDVHYEKIIICTFDFLKCIVFVSYTKIQITETGYFIKYHSLIALFVYFLNLSTQHTFILGLFKFLFPP